MNPKNGAGEQRVRASLLQGVRRWLSAGIVGVSAVVMPHAAVAGDDPCLRAVEADPDAVVLMTTQTAGGVVYLSAGRPPRVIKRIEEANDSLPILLLASADTDLVSNVSIAGHQYVPSGVQGWESARRPLPAWRQCPRLFHTLGQPTRPYLEGDITVDRVKVDIAVASWSRSSPPPEPLDGREAALRVDRPATTMELDVALLDDLRRQVRDQLRCSRNPPPMPRTCALVQTRPLDHLGNEAAALRASLVEDLIGLILPAPPSACLGNRLDRAGIGALVLARGPRSRWMVTEELLDRTLVRWGAGGPTARLAAGTVEACHVAASRHELQRGVGSCPVSQVGGKLIKSGGLDSANLSDAIALAALYLEVEASSSVSRENGWRSGVQLWLRDQEVVCRAEPPPEALRRLAAAAVDDDTSAVLVLAAELAAGSRGLGALDPEAFRTLSLAVMSDRAALSRLVQPERAEPASRLEVGVSPQLVVGARFIGGRELHGPFAFRGGLRWTGSSAFVGLDPIDVGQYLTTEKDQNGDLGIRHPRPWDFVAPTVSAGFTFGRCVPVSLGVFAGTSRLAYDDQKLTAGVGVGVFLPVSEVGHE